MAHVLSIAFRFIKIDSLYQLYFNMFVLQLKHPDLRINIEYGQMSFAGTLTVTQPLFRL